MERGGVGGHIAEYYTIPFRIPDPHHARSTTPNNHDIQLHYALPTAIELKKQLLWTRDALLYLATEKEWFIKQLSKKVLTVCPYPFLDKIALHHR